MSNVALIGTMNDMNEVFRHFVLLSVTVLFFGLIFVVRKWPQGLHHTFSQHAATSRTGIAFYILLFSIVLPLLLLFFFGWFIPATELSAWFDFFIVVAVVSQYICTLVPETTDKRRQVHRALAFVSALSLLPAVFLIAAAEISIVSTSVSALAVAVMAAIMVLLVRNKTAHKYLLFIQSAYFSVFFIAIITATYLR